MLLLVLLVVLLLLLLLRVVVLRHHPCPGQGGGGVALSLGTGLAGHDALEQVQEVVETSIHVECVDVHAGVLLLLLTATLAYPTSVRRGQLHRFAHARRRDARFGEDGMFARGHVHRVAAAGVHVD